MTTIDLNSDVGEFPLAVDDGSQETLLQFVTSANIACGGHAGDPHTMRSTIAQAQKWNVAVGAHPGYEDRANFGRIEKKLTAAEISDSVFRQVAALAKIAEESGATIVHVKPHGALYNQASADTLIARAIADGVRRWGRDVALVGLAGSVMLDEFRAAGFRVLAEAFVDRRYEPNGRLRSRKSPDALLIDPQQTAQQALRIVTRGEVVVAGGAVIPLEANTLCLHSDTEGALQIAQAVHETLRDAGVELRSPLFPGIS
jgi:5-oxoprolinase (ATP-hydrolysing) subunit A